MASPKGAAISFSPGLLRRSSPRYDTLLISFVLLTCAKIMERATTPDVPPHLFPLPPAGKREG